MPIDSVLTSRIEVYLSCSDLPQMDLLTKSDPFICVYIKIDNNWEYLGRTETLMNTHYPQFTKQFHIDYHFEENQMCRFDIYDQDDTSDNLQAQDFIGRVETSLAHLVSSSSSSHNLFDRSLRSKKQGRLHIHIDQVIECKQSVILHFSAQNLPHSNWCGKPNTYLELCRIQENGPHIPVVRTSVCTQTTCPVYAPLSCSIQKLSNADLDRPVLVRCLQAQYNREAVLVGECQIIVKDLLNCQEFPRSLYRSSKTIANLQLERVQIETVPSFIDYLQGGMQIQLCIGVDFTASNGDPLSPESLHYMGPTQNAYEKAIHAVGSILLPYDTDQHVPVWGFGAKYQREKVEHAFPLTLDEARDQVEGIEHVLGAYRHSLQHVVLSGPTLFAPVINKAFQLASRPFTEEFQHYTILLLLTDGIINDIEQTTKAIVEASHFPLSIIVVGIGDADFSTMHFLDADDTPLVSNGRQMKRDIVQFVPYSKFEKVNSTRLAAAVLEEIPDQLLGFCKLAQVAPGQPKHCKPVAGS